MKFSFFFTLLLLVGCRQTPPAPKRNLQCYIRFDAARGQVLADATVRLSSDPAGQPAELPGGLLYQSTPMQILPVQGLTYRRGYAADFVADHTFSWTNEQGQPQQVEFPMAPITNFTFGDQPLSRMKPATLRWTGGPLQKGEALVLMWENKRLNQTVPMEIIRSGGDASLDFPAAKIAELAPGQWTLYIVRKRLIKNDLLNMAVEGVVEYYSKSDTIQVL